MKESVYTGLNSAKVGVVSGGKYAYEKAGQGASMVTSTIGNVNWTKEKATQGAVYAYQTGSAVNTKMSDAGVYEKAGQAAEYGKAAGGFVYDKGAAGASYVNQRIDENATLSSMKTSAQAGATQAAAAASAAASQAVNSMSSWFGWGSNSNNN